MHRPFTYQVATSLVAAVLIACQDATPPTAAAPPARAQLEDVSVADTTPVIDTTPPVITYTIDGRLGQNGWYTLQPVIIEFTITDPESPAAPSVATTCRTWFIWPPGVRTSAFPLCVAVSAGGTSEVRLDVLIDNSPPDIVPPFTISPAASAPGWWNTDVSITYTCIDWTEGSGLLERTPVVTVSTEGVKQPFTATCTDSAGNSVSRQYADFPVTTLEPWGHVDISIDKTRPVLAPTVSPNPVLLNGSAAASPNATDALSGLASQSCGALVTSSVGVKTVTCTATDSAANVSTASVAYSVVYPFTGFFGLNAPPALNSARAGASVLVKFSLGGNRGLGVLAAGSPTSQPISCTTGATLSTLKALAVAGASLTYTTKTNTYSYTWRTDQAWAGTCRRLAVKLVDGTERMVNFQFRK